MITMKVCKDGQLHVFDAPYGFTIILTYYLILIYPVCTLNFSRHFDFDHAHRGLMMPNLESFVSVDTFTAAVNY